MAEPGAGGANCCAAVAGAAVSPDDDGTRCKCPDGRPNAVVAVDQKRRTAVTSCWVGSAVACRSARPDIRPFAGLKTTTNYCCCHSNHCSTTRWRRTCARKYS